MVVSKVFYSFMLFIDNNDELKMLSLLPQLHIHHHITSNNGFSSSVKKLGTDVTKLWSDIQLYNCIYNYYFWFLGHDATFL